MAFGNNLRKYRKERGFTLVQLSENLGISTSYLSSLERGVKKPSLTIINKLTECLHIPPSYLFGEIERPRGSKIAFIREGRGFSEESLAQVTGISVEQIKAFEEDREVPTDEQLLKIADKLKVTVRYFFEEDVEKADIGKRIRNLREAKSYSLVKLAEIACVSPGMISQIENSQTKPSIETLEKLATALDVSICYLLLEQEDVMDLLIHMNKELLELLQDPRVQTLLRSVKDFSAGELKYILNHIHFFKNNSHLLK